MIGKKLEASSQKGFCDGLPALVLNAIVEHRWCQLMLVSKQHLQNSQANKKERRQLASYQQFANVFLGKSFAVLCVFSIHPNTFQ